MLHLFVSESRIYLYMVHNPRENSHLAVSYEFTVAQLAWRRVVYMDFPLESVALKLQKNSNWMYNFFLILSLVYA